MTTTSSNHQRIIRIVSKYSFSGGSTRDYADLQEMICPSREYSIPQLGGDTSPEVVSLQQRPPPITSEIIARLFANELEELRGGDPHFIGTKKQIDYIKEVISTDKYLYK